MEICDTPRIGLDQPEQGDLFLGDVLRGQGGQEIPVHGGAGEAQMKAEQVAPVRLWFSASAFSSTLPARDCLTFICRPEFAPVLRIEDGNAAGQPKSEGTLIACYAS